MQVRRVDLTAAERCLEDLCGIRCNDPVGVASRLVSQWADAVITNKNQAYRLGSCAFQVVRDDLRGHDDCHKILPDMSSISRS